MDELKVLDVVNKSSDDKINTFSSGVNSGVSISRDYNIFKYDDEWLLLMEETVPYIDNILRNPNRFIINEEEVVKIELARKITVESIKHLSRNTNFIQEIDEDTGDVKPSKILNINKEENYNTYENRFIYSLIQNMKMYIDRKKRNLTTGIENKNEKYVSYKGNSKSKNEEIEIDVNFKSKLTSQKGGVDDVLARISNLEMHIGDLTNTDLYQTIDKLHISLVRSPLKKTNLILKNVNFQYAVNLWNFLQVNLEDNSRFDTGNNVDESNPELKALMDESFLLNYLIVETITNPEENVVKQKKVTDQLINNFIQKMVITNSEITKSELEKMVGDQFVIIKEQSLSSSNEIKRIFKSAINSYKDKINEIELRKKNEKSIEHNQ